MWAAITECRRQDGLLTTETFLTVAVVEAGKSKIKAPAD